MIDIKFDPIRFARIVKANRELLGLSQQQLADLIGVHKTRIQGYERGDLECGPRAEVLIRMAFIFSMSIDALVGR